MRRALVIYDTKFGNTKKVARALAKGMKKGGVDVDCLKIDAVDINKVAEYDLIAVGGPTHMLGISKPMKEFIEKLKSADLRGKKAFAFDTKVKSRFAGSAAKEIDKNLGKLGMNIVKSRQSAIVKGREGPLEDRAEETFEGIGVEIAKFMQ